MKNPYENLMFWVVTQDPAQPHIHELTRLIEDAALQEAKIQKLESRLEEVSRRYIRASRLDGKGHSV